MLGKKEKHYYQCRSHPPKKTHLECIGVANGDGGGHIWEGRAVGITVIL